MFEIFKKVTIMAVVVAAVLFALQAVMGIVDTIFSLIGAAFGVERGSGRDGLASAGVGAEGFSKLLAAVACLLIIWKLVKIVGGKILGQTTLRGMSKEIGKRSTSTIKNSYTNIKDMVRGVTTKDGLKAMGRNANLQSLMGNKGVGNLWRKGAKAQNNLDMMKSLRDAGKSGRLSKEDKKKREAQLDMLKSKGITPEDTRKKAEQLSDAKMERRLNELGFSKDVFNELNEDDKSAIDTISSDSKKGFAEKVTDIHNILRHHWRVEGDESGEGADVLTQKRMQAAMAHGQNLDKHIKQMEQELDGAEVTFDDGSTMSALQYADYQDGSAIGTSEKFRSAHRELMGAYLNDKNVPGSRTMNHALDISRTDQEMKDATVNGSDNSQLQQPIASSDESKQDMAAKVHGGLSIDKEAADKSAERAQVDAKNAAESSTGMKSSDVEPAADNIPRDENGAPISIAQRDGDDIQRSADALNNGAMGGSVLPDSITSQPASEITPEKVAEAYDDSQYVKGTNNPNVFAQEPLEGSGLPGVQNAMETGEVINNGAGAQGATQANAMAAESETAYSDNVAPVAERPAFDERAPEREVEREVVAERPAFDERAPEREVEREVVTERPAFDERAPERPAYNEYQYREAQNFNSASEFVAFANAYMSQYVPNATFTPEIGHAIQQSVANANTYGFSQDDLMRGIAAAVSGAGAGALSREALNGQGTHVASVDPQVIDDIVNKMQANNFGATIQNTMNHYHSNGSVSSTQSESRVPSGGEIFGSGDSDIDGDAIARETARRRAEAEEEERQSRGTEGIRDTGRGGRKKRGE